MSIQNIKNEDGITISEWIGKIPNELEYDYVGLWQIVQTGKYKFGLLGPELTAFARLAVTALLDRGAVPVDGPNPKRETKYGTSNEQIIDNIVGIWLRDNAPDPDVGDVWFGLPEKMPY